MALVSHLSSGYEPLSTPRRTVGDFATTSCREQWHALAAHAGATGSHTPTGGDPVTARDGHGP